MSDKDFMCQLLYALPKEFLPLKVTMLDKDLAKMTWEKFLSFVIAVGRELAPTESEKLMEELPCGVTSFQART